MVAQNNGVLNCENANMLRADAPAQANSHASSILVPDAPKVADRMTNSYLVALASDVQISARELKALAVTEGDIQSIVQSVGKKLYGNARWSGSYIRW